MKDQLTGKCKEAFDIWYVEHYLGYLALKTPAISDFWNKKPSEQYGVIEDFSDSEGLNISIHCFGGMYHLEINDSKELDSFDTRSEARQKAVEKFNEIFNNRK